MSNIAIAILELIQQATIRFWIFEVLPLFVEKKSVKGAYWISSNIAIAILYFSLLLPI